MSHASILAWTLGPMEMAIVGGIALLLFGHRLPSVMRSLGRGLVEFKKGTQEDPEDDIEAETETGKVTEK